MILVCEQSIDWWSTASNICSSLLSIATITFMIWGVRAWRREFVGKRRIELGEQARAAFYAVRDAIAFIRDWNLKAERGDALTYTDVLRNRYKATEDAFSRFQAIKHRVMATFGKDSESIFAEINKICWKMQEASGYADMYEVHLKNATDLVERKKLLDIIEKNKDEFMKRRGRNNEIGIKLDGIGARLEEATK